jgi:hypothetical protein
MVIPLMKKQDLFSIAARNLIKAERNSLYCRLFKRWLISFSLESFCIVMGRAMADSENSHE